MGRVGRGWTVRIGRLGDVEYGRNCLGELDAFDNLESDEEAESDDA